MDDPSLAGFVWWWIAVVAMFVVVIPLVLYLIQRILAHISEIGGYADDVLDHGVAVTRNLEPVPALLETRDSVRSASDGLGSYVDSVNLLLRKGTP